jgi:hypothetical protein
MTDSTMMLTAIENIQASIKRMNTNQEEMKVEMNTGTKEVTVKCHPGEDGGHNKLHPI